MVLILELFELTHCQVTELKSSFPNEYCGNRGAEPNKTPLLQNHFVVTESAHEVLRGSYVSAFTPHVGSKVLSDFAG